MRTLGKWSRFLIRLSTILIVSGCNVDNNSNQNSAGAELKSSSVTETSAFKTVNPGGDGLRIVEIVTQYGDDTFDPKNKGTTKKFSVGEIDSTVYVVTQAKATDYIQPPYISIAQNGVWKFTDKDLIPQGFQASDFTYANDRFVYYQKDSNEKQGLYQYRISSEGRLGDEVYIPMSTDQEMVSRIVKTTKGPAIVVRDGETDSQKDIHYSVHLANFPDEKISFIDKFGAFSFNNVFFDLENQKAYYIHANQLKVFDLRAGEPTYQDGRDKIYHQFKSNNIQMELDNKGNLFILEDNLLQFFDHQKNVITHSIKLPIPTIDPIFDPVPILSFRHDKLFIWYYQDYERKASLNKIVVSALFH